MYCMTLHCGGGELSYRVLLGCLVLECDHLRGGNLLRVVYFDDTPFSSVGERVDARNVFLVGEGSWSVGGGMELLQWALRSSDFRRLEILDFRGRIHSSGGQVT